ncbi:MAG TPA: tetratricopeptide repeat protein [Bryobacteraceae bacterium]
MLRYGLLWLGAVLLAAPVPGAVTFTHDVAPILFKKCATCHFPGGPAPFSLTDYLDAKKRASAIAAATRNRSMPPWLAAPGYAHFVGENERTLANQELQTIQEWVKQGAPEGNPSDLPPLPRFSRWPLGKPDLILKLAHPYTLPAHGMDGMNVMRNFVIPVPIKKTRYVKALILIPGADRKLFFHSNVLYDPTGLYRLHSSDMGEPGFMGMSLEVESDHFNPEGHFLLWKAGTAPAAQIDGMPWRLKPGSDLVLNMHMLPDGKPHKIQPVVGLYFTDKPPTKHPMLIELHNTNAINIPAGDKHFLVTDEVTLPLDVEVFAVYPHAHYLGKTLVGYAILPGGEKKWLLRIPDWNPEWTAVFRYAKPLFLPKGTSVHMHFVYDNSVDNQRNPNHPPKRVVGGDEATDDMAEFWLQVLPVHTENLQVDPRLVLQETMTRHDLAMNPHDPLALFNLGAALQAEGKMHEAVTYYERELRVRPGDAVAETALGGALQAEGKIEQAAKHYQAALATSPKYVNAHYNLGVILLTQGQFEQAAEQFRAVLAFNPDDASSHNNLGTALASLGKWDAAAAEFQQALRLDPKNANAHDNLGYILLRQGEGKQALAHFREAVRLEPGNPGFHDDLAGALLQQGKAEEATTQFQHALEINPQDATARSGLQKAQMLLTRAK